MFPCFIRSAEDYEDELLRASVELMSTAEENQRLLHDLASLDSELQELQNSIRQCEREIAELKNNPEATAGTKSERIEK